MAKVTLFILKETKELYAFSDDKKLINDFKDTRCMKNFIVKEKKMDSEEYDSFIHINNDKILNMDYLYDGKNVIEFTMTTNESFKLDLEIDQMYKKVGDSEIIRYIKIFKGKYRKSLKRVFDFTSSFYYNGETEFNSINIFIKLFKFTMLERINDE